MIALVVTMNVSADRQAEFEAAFSALAEATLSNEPGVRLYQLCHSRSDPTLYRLLEIYEDQAAHDHHLTTEWLKAAGPKIGPMVIGEATIEYLDTVN